MKLFTKKHMIKTAIICLPLLLTLGLRLVWNKEGFGDWYSTHIFPIFPNTLGRLFSFLPFSVYEWILYILGLFLIVFVGSLFVKGFLLLSSFIKKKSRRNSLPSFRRKHFSKFRHFVFSCLFFIGCLASFATFLLHYADLVQYRRSSIAKDFHIEVTEHSIEELTSLCKQLAKQLNILSKEIPVDDQGLLKLPTSYANDAKEAMQALGKQYPVFSGYYPNPKPVTFSKGMSYLNLTGLYSPFTIEANYNNDVPSYNIPYTICHELAHLKGIVPEDEAGFVAYVACAQSDNAVLQYSGNLNAFIYATNALYDAGETKTYDQIFSSLEKQVLKDISYNSYYWNQFEGKVSKVAETANDVYLKANHQEDGVKSYGRMVDLMLSLNDLELKS